MTDKTIEGRIGWLAGVIDGEGSLSLFLRKPAPAALKWKVAHNRSGEEYRYLNPILTISNTDEAMIVEIRAIAELLGIKSFLWQDFLPKEPKHKPHWRITFKSKLSCEAVLLATLPYLVTKRARAELVLRAIAHRRSFGWPARGRSPANGYIPVAQDPVLAQMVGEMKHLNRRGRAPQEV